MKEVLNTALRWAGFVKYSRLIVYALLLVTSLGIAFLISNYGVVSGVLIIVLLIGIPAVLYIIGDIKFGVILLIVYSFFMPRLSHFTSNLIPLGIIFDVLLLLMLAGLIIKKWQKNDLSLSKGPISYVIWIWLIYNAFEFFNPMQSREAWIYVIRSMAGHMIFYFIVLEAVDNISFFRKMIAVWIVLAFFGALYGLFQEFHGLLESEVEWIMRDEVRFKLFYNWGRYRKFSFFNDPTVFGILMSYTGLFCIALLNGPFKLAYKIFLFICGVTMFLSVIYAGTRTAYAMIPAGFCFFALITFQKKVLVITSVIMALAAFIIFSDIKNVGSILTRNSLERIRSAFNPTEDPSYNVRLNNQAKIKPFIKSHPFGAGIGSIGTWGERFNPNSILAGFDADSTYVRIAVELGWVGLLLYFIFFAVILIVGIRNYYKIKNTELKIYTAGILAVIYSIIIANYPQIAILQIPTIFIFNALVASMVKLGELDKKL